MHATASRSAPAAAHKDGPAPSGARGAQQPSTVNSLWTSLATSTAGLVQRTCAACAAKGTPCPKCEEDEKHAVQTKLKVGAPNDRYEVEADRVADRVMRMPSPLVSVAPTAGLVHRQESALEEDEEEDRTLQAKPIAGTITPLIQRDADEDEEDEDLVVQEKRRSDQVPIISPSQQRYIEGLPFGGHPLPDAVRAQFEPRFGYGFGGVRVHTDGAAQRSASDLRARAYTVGGNVVFGAGEYAPHSSTGMRLLAHELTHVVQQGAASSTTSGPSALDPPGGNSAVTAQRAPKPVQEEDVPVPEEAEEAPIFDIGDAAFEAQEDVEEGDGDPVEALGVVEPDKGLALWPEMGNATPHLGILPMNTQLFVERKLPGDWLSVYVERHQRGAALPVATGTHGFVDATRVNLDPPDPDAWFYRITTPGQGALALAGMLYPNYAVDCALYVTACRDWRYLVNVLVAVNEAKGRKYVYKEHPNDDWDEAKVRRDGKIWVPGMQLVKALEGQISSGSISLEVLTTLKDIAIGVAAFVVGLLHGAFMSIADIFIGLKDLIVLAWDIFKKLIDGTLISSARAFWDEISQISFGDIVKMLGAKWNAPSTWDRWKFRGYVIGYAIMEILLLVFSAGALTAIKWAGKAAKLGKFVEYITKLPKVQKVVEATKALKGKAVDEIKAVLKAAEAMSEAHGWAAKALRLPVGILRRLSEVDIEKLKKLPQWARERFAMLADEAKLLLLGCHSPCAVDPKKIVAALKAATTVGTKLTSPDGVLKAIKAVDSSFMTAKISAKLRRKNSALMVAIKEAGLTDADFAHLVHFITAGDKTNHAMAYRTFVRYVTNLVPAKVGPDINKLNDIATKLVDPSLLKEARRGAALKGAMFEQWVAMHIPKFAGRSFGRITFDLKALIKKKVPPLKRHVDKWVPGSGGTKGQIWDMKHHVGRVPADQVDDYAKLVSNNIVGSVNYLFPSQKAAMANRHLLSRTGFLVYYVDDVTNTLKRLY